MVVVDDPDTITTGELGYGVCFYEVADVTRTVL